jgi:serpin B
MRHRTWTSLGLLAAACAAAAVVGCGSTPAAPARVDVAMMRGVAMAEPVVSPRPLAAADTGFGLDVMRAWCAENPGQNLVFSPSTLASALGLAYLGARGATATAMARVLDLPATSRSALEAALQARAKALGGLDGPGVTLAASDQVWADPTLKTLRAYLDAVATGYHAGVAQAPFSTDPAKAADEINQAISAATRGHITQLVSADMLDDIGWVLTSALYLNAKWAAPFDPNSTQPGTFTMASGAKSLTVKFMNGGYFPYATASGWQAVSLPYQGGKLAMTALLPPAGSGSCALPSQTSLTAIARSLDRPGGVLANVSMPKVNLDTSGDVGDMEPALKQLGMGLAFGDGADFTGLSPQACCIGFVQQAATLQVGEKGTVGAAAAAVGITASAGVVQLKAVNIVFNRPYLLLITAQATGEPLFLAKVDNPNAS